MPDYTIRFQGVFDYERIYQYIFQWMKDYEYDFYEDEWVKKKSEQEWKFHGDRKVNFLIKFVIKFHFKIVDMKHIIKDGKEYTYGRFFLKITPSWEEDPLSIFKGKSKFIEWLGRKYFDVFQKKEIGAKYIEVLLYRAQELQFKIKQMLGMDTSQYEYKYKLGLTK